MVTYLKHIPLFCSIHNRDLRRIRSTPNLHTVRMMTLPSSLSNQRSFTATPLSSTFSPYNSSVCNLFYPKITCQIRRQNAQTSTCHSHPQMNSMVKNCVVVCLSMCPCVCALVYVSMCLCVGLCVHVLACLSTRLLQMKISAGCDVAS